ncbi:PREDICTED: cysteine-rich motor neuron 1 protein-like isoform X3 [Polistes dominula]|uniref:Cysteine-rich motor neuron 1 protein-like isoform X3 n=1 Tax=Polistes dominula TaxID=743375 RepID=A0ABM1I1D7_POLDO|nr:PREDICTED: cysteine-rich motor neuron 1 protein-like isoform X3 [Polistes dominula]
MRASLLLLGGIIVVLSIAVARALSCVCSPLECDILTDEDCPGGLTWDPCRCCKVCARVEGEPCGGLFGFSGSCAVGLQCIIKNLLPHTREVDEGVCAKIPGRWRRHCPNGPIMSGPGCNLVDDGTSDESGNAVASGKCVCGPSVPWCPGEPRPYDYRTRHECKLNLAAKIAYDDLLNSEDRENVVVNENENELLHGTRCPEDSVENENGECKCSPCPSPPVCSEPGQRLLQTKIAIPGTPGSCCSHYECLPSGHQQNGHQEGQDQQQSSENGCPRDSVPSEDDVCKCVPMCPPASCKPGERAVEVRQAVPNTPGFCCPLYKCVPSESVYLVETEESGNTRNCFFKNGLFRRVGEHWKDEPCVNCTCQENGQVSCIGIMCKSCANPIPPDPGECCSHCPQPTSLTDVDIDSSKSNCKTSLIDCNLDCNRYLTDENGCQICECYKPTKNEMIHPGSEEDKLCPELSNCELNCDLVKDEFGCSICACQSISNLSSTSTPLTPSRNQQNLSFPSTNRTWNHPNIDNFDNNDDKKVVCPEVNCDLHCERGLMMDENDCTLCECKPLHENCPSFVGCKKKCRFGYKTNKRGCPICRCRASCINDENEPIQEGESWLRNACTTCTCEIGGRVNCKETVCSVACSDPLPPEPNTCCPVCPITENEGNHQNNRGWGVVPITLIVVLALLCLLLIIHIVRSRFRGRLSPSDASYSYPPQYYKCVPAYDTPMHRNEKIVPL